MVKVLKSGLRNWTNVLTDQRKMIAEAKAGDRVVDDPSPWANASNRESAWRGLRLHLAERGLSVEAIGSAFYLVRWDARPQVPLLLEMAQAGADGDRAAQVAVRDVIVDVFGDVPGLADAIVRNTRKGYCRAGKRPRSGEAVG